MISAAPAWSEASDVGETIRGRISRALSMVLKTAVTVERYHGHHSDGVHIMFVISWEFC
jgi:hypothetical protein